MSPPTLVLPQALLLQQRQLQACGLRPGDAVLVPCADKQNDRLCYCVCVAWPDNKPEFGTSSLAQAERGYHQTPSVLAPFDTNSFDPCVMLSYEAQVAAACYNSAPHNSSPPAPGGASDTPMPGAWAAGMAGLLCLPHATRRPIPATVVELEVTGSCSATSLGQTERRNVRFPWQV